jgi:formamidopyrimidine-DNA glycosylase
LPELPEVETVVRGLRTALRSRRILSVRLGKTDFVEDAAAIERELPGRRIADVVRHGKFLILRLEPTASPDARLFLLVHLGMTGQLVARRPEETVPPHTHAFFSLDDGRELRYTDIRRFGRMLLVPEARLDAVLRRLGDDPLEAALEEFRARLDGRRARIKALLLDQRVLRGMGNIYTDESLWRARVHPARHASELNAKEIRRLYQAIQAVLREAIRLRGSSVSDYVDAEGQPGEYQLRHRVYQREGEACVRCGARIRRVMVAGRSSYFCPRCQPRPSRGQPAPRPPRTNTVPTKKKTPAAAKATRAEN